MGCHLESGLIVEEKTLEDMEEEGLLDADDEHDMYCLHTVYYNVISEHLKEFVGYWNAHRLRGRPTPTQMFIDGTIALQERATNEGREFTELRQVNV
ncbi:hypothetical protein DAPPUDRAFT_247551 [Daphnia pulex]|uniref:Integrase core domain-containing protein n=1 Tax=Daphnia pulex TaxID=6669 RepID=E9GSP1_DAPPU|nr:hypothetical protein DAPPUDRAFT_247551 [Daphnia pulex]|eukprot:EFX77462.1 hypothetical protein DAPPUDRAFT_247551 [Daphnia pulex]